MGTILHSNRREKCNNLLSLNVTGVVSCDTAAGCHCYSLLDCASVIKDARLDAVPWFEGDVWQCLLDVADCFRPVKAMTFCQ